MEAREKKGEAVCDTQEGKYSKNTLVRKNESPDWFIFKYYSATTDTHEEEPCGLRIV